MRNEKTIIMSRRVPAAHQPTTWHEFVNLQCCIASQICGADRPCKNALLTAHRFSDQVKPHFDVVSKNDIKVPSHHWTIPLLFNQLVNFGRGLMQRSAMHPLTQCNTSSSVTEQTRECKLTFDFKCVVTYSRSDWLKWWRDKLVMCWQITGWYNDTYDLSLTQSWVCLCSSEHVIPLLCTSSGGKPIFLFLSFVGIDSGDPLIENAALRTMLSRQVNQFSNARDNTNRTKSEQVQ